MILQVPGLSVEDVDGGDVAWLAMQSTGGDAERCVKLLSQDQRVNWNTKNGAGDTPLMFCLENNKTDMAKVILSNPRVFINTKNNEGKNSEAIAR